MKTLFIFLFSIQILAFANYTWGSPEDIFACEAVCPNMITNSAGNVAISALKKTEQGFIPLVSTRFREGSWNIPIDLPQSKDNLNDHPLPAKALLNSQGKITAIWIEKDHLGRKTLQTSTKHIDQEWSSPSCLSTGNFFPDCNDDVPEVAVDSFDNITIIWERTQGEDETTILSTTKSDTGDWLPYTQLSQSGLVRFPCISINPAGEAIAAWTRFDGTRSTRGDLIIQAVTRQLNQSWTEPFDVSIKYKGSWFYEEKINGAHPHVAINLSGNAAIVWQNTKSTQSFISEKLLGNNWTDPQELTDEMLGELIFRPKVAIDNSGNIISLWQKIYLDMPFFFGKTSINNFIDSAIKSIDSESSTKFSSEILTDSLIEIEDYLNGKDLYPSKQIGFDCDNNAFAAWTKHTADNSIIQLSIKLPNEPWSSPMDLAYTNGWASKLQMNIDSNRDIILVWEEGPEGSRCIKSLIGSSR